MQLNDIFTYNEYDTAYEYVKNNNYTIKEIESLNGERRFKIVEIPQPTQKELNEQEIEMLKNYLESTDYVVIKIAEGVATAEEYADVIAERARARATINQLGK